MMAANELNAHLFLQSDPKDICKNIQILLGGFETQTGEQVYTINCSNLYFPEYVYFQVVFEADIFMAVACFP